MSTIEKGPPSNFPGIQKGEEMLHLDIYKRETCNYVVRDSTKKEFGTINLRVSKALHELECMETLEYHALMSSSSWRTYKKYRDKSKGPPLEMTLEINIFGPQCLRDKVGKVLSTFRLHLQTPLGISENIVVDNPHKIVFPNLDCESSPLLGPSFLAPLPISSDAEKLTVLLENLDQNDSFEIGSSSKMNELDLGISTVLLMFVFQSLYCTTVGVFN